jgi:hypothetical protein
MAIFRNIEKFYNICPAPGMNIGSRLKIFDGLYFHRIYLFANLQEALSYKFSHIVYKNRVESLVNKINPCFHHKTTHINGIVFCL